MGKRSIRTVAAACSRTAVCVLAAMMASCRTAPPQPVPGAGTLPPLLDSRPLTLGGSCSANGSFFVEFTVLSDGRTADLKLPAAPRCVQEALSAWIASFRYAQPAQQVVTGIEWTIVTARRGS